MSAMPARDPLLASLVIVSGGQTGADRAALDWAIAYGVRHGGWCPKGRRAEDGAIASRYGLSETPSPNYSERTEWNVRDSDATLIISVSPRLMGGSRATREFARRHGRPCLHVSGDRASAATVRRFIRKHRVSILNVAGPRASKEPDVYALVIALLGEVFSGARKHAVKRRSTGTAKLVAP